jgi:addiction module HigA family antidote
MRKVPDQSYLGRDFVATASAAADPDHEPYPAPSAGLFCLARLRAHDRLRSITTEDSMKNRRMPTTPGEILREEFLEPLAMTQKQLADHIGCDVKVINRIVNGRTSVTAEMALKLGATFRTTPEFWLNAQRAVDLHRAASRLPESLRMAS